MHCLTPPPARRPNRSGVTLTEVLMSLMIMSIGVAAVATLFPIAALRSAQATRLTNAAILKYNVEAMIRARPELIFDPDGDFINSTPGSTGYWSRLTEHFRSNAEKNYIIDPSGYFIHAGTYDTEWGTIGSGGGNAINAVPPASRKFCDYFGNTAAPAAGTGTPTTYSVLPRYDGGLRSLGLPTTLSASTLRDYETLASELSNLGDGWDTVVDAVALGYVLSDGSTTAAPAASDAVVGVVLDSDIDLSSIVTSAGYASVLSVSDPEFTRITVFRSDDRISQSFPLTGISGSSCVWTESIAGTDYNGNGVTDLRALPVEFYSSSASQYEIGRVVIQTRRTQDFNWMLTVRREADGRASGVDVVVMFSDGRKPDTERVFPASFTANEFGVTVARTSGVDLNGDPAEPFLKRGGFVLDVENARWYRIANYRDNPADGGATYLVTLESAAVESSPSGGGGAIFLPGVVDVYPLGTVALPESMTPQAF